MITPHTPQVAGDPDHRRLFVFNGGFLTQKRVKRILSLSGYSVKLGAPGADDLVGVWGNSPTAYRGETVADKMGAQIVRVEDAWLRSLHPGRSGDEPIGLVIDRKGVHYDPTKVSDLEEILLSNPLDDTALLDRARGMIERVKEAHLTKYSAVDPELDVPAPGYVLVIDQTEGDASVTACGADRNRFLEMLFVAQDEHPAARIIIKTHPETDAGHREGYFRNEDLRERVEFFSGPVSPWKLMEGAIAIYTVSSQLGFEAIFAGHKPRVFGAPFYAGWGLTQDEFPVQRRQRKLTRAQLFAAAMILYPKWYNPLNDSLCPLETAVENLAACARAWREDRHGWVASGMRMWKRPHIQSMFGREQPVLFEDTPGPARASGRRWMVWSSKAAVGQTEAVQVEDGFLRSRGLGAELAPPLSLIVDDQGIYYDPKTASRLESLISARATLRPDQERRAQALIETLRTLGVNKYNLGGSKPELPPGHKVLVVGQVEDDASVKLGAGAVSTNAALLAAARAGCPNSCLIYKPHPDVEAGLRPGGTDSENGADIVAAGADTDWLLSQVDAVWTMTSLLGFEALVRGVPVTTLGAPFYAGWRLTEDKGLVPPRRRAEPSLEGLVHASLIDYPRYLDPETGLPCPVEHAVDVLSRQTAGPRRSPLNRMLSKLQGVFASHAHRWR